MDYQPRTELGKQLLSFRKAYIEEGGKMFSKYQLQKEMNKMQDRTVYIELEDSTIQILRSIQEWITDIANQNVSAEIWQAEMGDLSSDIEDLVSGEIAEDSSLLKGLGG